MSNGLSASEAVYGFMAWLTCRPTVLSVGSRHNCSEPADLIGEFCEANQLTEPREGWEKHLVHPQEALPEPA